jgi:arylsulfatase A-like enzyme
VTFDRFFVQPVCSPTRAEFLTGRYHPRLGVTGVSTGQERMESDEKTIADAFKSAGYATGAFGKWHNGSQWPHHPMARGFDEYFGHTSGHWAEYFDAHLEHNGRMVRTKGYIVDVCTDRALDFIERNCEQPFFCYVPFTTPHSPWAAPAADWERYKTLEPTQHATAAAQEEIDKTRYAHQPCWHLSRRNQAARWSRPFPFASRRWHLAMAGAIAYQLVERRGQCARTASPPGCKRQAL